MKRNGISRFAISCVALTFLSGSLCLADSVSIGDQVDVTFKGRVHGDDSVPVWRNLGGGRTAAWADAYIVDLRKSATGADIELDAFSYCIQIGVPVSPTVNPFTVVGLESYGNVADGAFGGHSSQLDATRVEYLEKLWDSRFEQSLLGAVNAAAFQIAIWNLLYETDPNMLFRVDAGAFVIEPYANNGHDPSRGTDAILVANDWLNALANHQSRTALWALQSEGSQDLLVTNHPTVVEPATVLLLGLGLAGAAVLRRRRS